MKVETDIITIIKESLIGRALIIVIMCVETFKTYVIFFIGYVIIHLTSHWPIIFSIMVSLLTLKIFLVEIIEKMNELLIKDR